MSISKLSCTAIVSISAGALVAGCGSPGSEGDAGAGSANYTIAVAQDFQGADRASYSSEAAKTLADIMQGRLLELETESGDVEACYDDAPAELKESSALVEEWSIAEDGMSIDFTLRDDVTSAAGNVLTSADVEWTIDRILEIDTTGTTLWFTVGGFDPDDPITIQDDQRFTLNLSGPNDLAPYALAGTAGMIYDAEAVQDGAGEGDPWGVDWLQDRTANFGPWDLQQFSSQKLVFEQNGNFEGDRGPLESMTVISVPDSSSRIQLLQTGEVEEVNGLNYTQMSQLEESGAVTIVRCDSTARDWFGVNVGEQGLDDPKVRQAISLALDRDAIAESVYRGFAEPAVSGLSAAFNGPEGEFYDYDPDRAQQLLDEVGASNLSITLSVNPAQPGAYASELSALIQQQLGAVGIDVSIKNVPSAVDYRDDGQAQSMQSWLLAESPAFQNAGYSAWLSFGAGGLQNYSGFSNDQVDELTEQLMSGEERAETSAEAAVEQLSQLADELQPAVYIVDRPTIFVRASCVSEVPTSTLMVDFSGAVTNCG